MLASGGAGRIAYDPPMAILHEATLAPGKIELLSGWLRGRAWFPDAGPGDPRRVASCRFDDPAGAVGMEIMVVRAGDGPPVHVPLTYRDSPLDGAERFLVGTMEHSVLGTRWVYDACGDPVYLAVLDATIRTGGGEAEEVLDGSPRTPVMSVRGNGTGLRGGAPTAEPGRVVRVEDGDPTVSVTDSLRLSVRRVLDDRPAGGPHVLTGVWDDQPVPLVLAYLG
jgi:maltokinase-like protein